MSSDIEFFKLKYLLILGTNDQPVTERFTIVIGT